MKEDLRLYRKPNDSSAVRQGMEGGKEGGMEKRNERRTKEEVAGRRVEGRKEGGRECALLLLREPCARAKCVARLIPPVSSEH